MTEKTDTEPSAGGIPVVVLSDPEVLRDPFTAYNRAREEGPLAQLMMPQLGGMWAFTRHEDCRAMLSDPRFALDGRSFIRPDAPPECEEAMRATLVDGPGHLRLRRLVAPAFTARRTAAFRPRIQRIVDGLLDELPFYQELGSIDLLQHFAQLLPVDVVCELVGIPEADRGQWREYAAAVASGVGDDWARAWPATLASAQEAVAYRRAKPGDDLISDLIRVRDEDGDRLTEEELVTLSWLLVIAGQTTINVVANGVDALLSHPDQLAALRADPALAPGAVEELMRWCGPTLMSMPRYPREDLELHGVPVRAGAPVIASVVAANRDPRVYPDPDRLDITRPNAGAGHLAFLHGPHFCLGAALGRVETEIALTSLLQRFPKLAHGVPPRELVRVADPGTWRLDALPVTV